MTYHSRVSGSLDAFETLSSAFVRAVPGALSGNTRGGIHVDQSRLTGGVECLAKLIKAALSAGWIMQALREWADDMVSASFPITSAMNRQRRVWLMCVTRLVLHRNVGSFKLDAVDPMAYTV